MSGERDVTLWPTRASYSRFAALCDDEVSSIFEDFEAAAIVQLNDMARPVIHLGKIKFNPDKMAQWCRANFGKVDATARSAHAGFSRWRPGVQTHKGDFLGGLDVIHALRLRAHGYERVLVE